MICNAKFINFDADHYLNVPICVAAADRWKHIVIFRVLALEKHCPMRWGIRT